ncbi:Proteophosphoglycan ppg4 [Rhodotorula toruloides ATCC 204091]|uniref:Proteophosphoglycan ppg4 n=1 Tax=Rhodotorula toruloides TaxID=5286 RepID=A0A0K3CE43_RHOTO|nr:Proteophosphoglycan ppg4 [Rhodotorula toruloides ATCC 204091]KAK4332855.1 Proteophosphoglycan ppg4 [Rhodotorula toruloides]PRQ73811.1 Proteophosphoglycan ppg4 [Rhodotorula toruloides]
MSRSLRTWLRCFGPLESRTAAPALPTPFSSPVRRLYTAAPDPPLEPLPTPPPTPIASSKRRRIRPVVRLPVPPTPRVDRWSGTKAIATVLQEALATGREQVALEQFKALLRREGMERLSAEEVEGFVWLFVQYRQPELARTAAAAMDAAGYPVSTRLAGKLLREFKNKVIVDLDALAAMLSWLSHAMVREKGEGGLVDVELVDTVMDMLKRLGKTDWLLEVFRAYRDCLDADDIGSPRLWQIAISAHTADGDESAARTLFDRWRRLDQQRRRRPATVENPSDEIKAESHSPPPEQPYLAMLDYYAARARSHPSTSDPAYRFVALCTKDGLAPSTKFLHSLLRLELMRHRWTSFWGIWKAFDELGVQRNHLTYSLGARASLWRLTTKRRPEPQSRYSPLHDVVSFDYTQVVPPDMRQFLRTVLSFRLEATGHRPHRRLSTKEDELVTVDLLNKLLDYFVKDNDWPAAAIVLETFKVHRFEPNPHTHAVVVCGIVKQWQRRRLDHKLDGLLGSVSAFDGPEAANSRRSWLVSPATTVDAVAKILELRKMRVALWTNREPADEVEEDDSATITVEYVPTTPTQSQEEIEAEQRTEERRRKKTQWMISRELRETGYLVELLRRCEGSSEEDWKALLAETRKEALPTPLKQPRVDQMFEGELGDARPTWSKGKRYWTAVRLAKRRTEAKERAKEPTPTVTMEERAQLEREKRQARWLARQARRAEERSTAEQEEQPVA